MKRLRELWKSLSFSNKLKLSYVIIFLIPLFLIGGFSYYSSLTFVQEQKKEELSYEVERVSKELQTKLYQVESSLSLVVNNSSFQEFLMTSPLLSNLEMSRIADTYIGPFLYNVLLSNFNVDKLQIFADAKLSVLTDLIMPSVAVNQSVWYKNVLNSASYVWWEEDGRLFVGRAMRNSITGEITGVARMRVKEALFTDSFNSFVTFPSNISIRSDRGVYYALNPEWHEESDAHRWSRTLAPLSWRIEVTFNPESLSSKSMFQLLLNLSVTISCLLLVVVLIHFISRSLVSRIFVLTYQIQEVREGKLDIQVDTSYKDEIGSLALSFQSMMKRINNLVLDSYRAEIKQKELELRLLQEKINPHFLYNILSTINWIAIKNNQSKISQMTNNLATFYRTALNHGREMSDLKTELDNIKSYVALQQIARDDSFEVLYDISPELLDHTVPNFIFQPIIENAIEHGIDRRREGNGKIVIRSETSHSHYSIFIEDNGMELYDQYGRVEFDERLFGYGLRNVHERIQLKSNANFGVRLYADAQGTHAVIRLPL
jgi:two-component system, sensor histidine kinase YesM